MLSRRSFTRLSLSTLPLTGAFAKPDSKIHGVRLGAQSYSFRDRPLDEAIQAIASIGLSYVELWQGHIEPRGATPDELKQWRNSLASVTAMKDVRRKFADAGIRVYALNYSFRDHHTDKEIWLGMEMAKALGTKYITASSKVSLAARLQPLAELHGVTVAMHNHSRLQPDEFARPEDFEQAMQGKSKIAVNLDIGHFVAAGFDPVAYLERHHSRIVTLHLKDRKRDQGANMPFGEGDTPIREVLRLLRTRRWGIPAMIEYEYKGGDTAEEVRRSYAYCRKALG